MTIIIRNKKNRPIASKGDLPTVRYACLAAKELLSALYLLDKAPTSVELRRNGERVWKKSTHDFVRDYILAPMEEREAAKEAAHAVV